MKKLQTIQCRARIIKITPELDDKMRILANLLIDKMLEKKELKLNEKSNMLIMEHLK